MYSFVSRKLRINQCKRFTKLGQVNKIILNKTINTYGDVIIYHSNYNKYTTVSIQRKQQ